MYWFGFIKPLQTAFILEPLSVADVNGTYLGLKTNTESFPRKRRSDVSAQAYGNVSVRRIGTTLRGCRRFICYGMCATWMSPVRRFGSSLHGRIHGVPVNDKPAADPFEDNFPEGAAEYSWSWTKDAGDQVIFEITV